jgi:hypothetical protein
VCRHGRCIGRVRAAQHSLHFVGGSPHAQFATESGRNREYTAASKIAAQTGEPTRIPPASELDRLQETWAKLMPHRTLEVQDDKLAASVGARN